MELRNGSLVGGSSGRLSVEYRPLLEEGVRLILRRWTALCLAVENEWGGRESSEKAERLLQNILSWFYNNDEHYADDLEIDLDEILIEDFNTEAQDDSSREISRELVALHNELLIGNQNSIHRLRLSNPAALDTCKDLEEASQDMSAEESSSLEDCDIEMSEGQSDAISAQLKPKHQPVIDDDGFCLVQTRRKGRDR